jgi:hypothetical protein
LCKRSLVFARRRRGSSLGFACAGGMWPGLLRKSFGASRTLTVTLSQGDRVRETIMSRVRPRDALADMGLCTRLQRAMTILSPDQFRMAPKGNCKFRTSVHAYAELMAAANLPVLGQRFKPFDCMNPSRGVRIKFIASEQVRPSC